MTDQGRGGIGSHSSEFSLAEQEDRMAWIFGSSRSGSTWLLRMLAALDGVVAIDDPHLGHHLGVWRPIALAWATAERMPELNRLDHIKRREESYFFSDRYREQWQPALQDLILRRFEVEARERLSGHRNGKPMVVIKEPGSHVADWLCEMFPRSRLIFLLRDGRDVVDSWLDAYQAQSWGVDKGMYPVADRGRLALIRWQASVWLYRTEVVQHAYAAHDPRARLMIRYEELRRDPGRQLRRIRDAFDLSADDGRIASAVEEHSDERVPGAEKGAGKAIRLARPGSWREHMTPAEIRGMHQILAPKLDQLGYLTPADRRISSVA
jgi:Sulfotransferase family